MNTNVEKVTPSGVFTNYIFKSIPLAFDESMSYYECLCGLLDYLKNTVIPTINNNADAIIEVQENVSDFETNITEDFNDYKTLINNTVEELETYVNNYFNNLDVQQEVNNKLDEMVLDGTMDQIVNTNITGTLSNLNTTNKSNLVSAINEVNDKAGKSIYSSNEVVIGSWINGKPLYRKVINTGDLTDSTRYTDNDLYVNANINELITPRKITCIGGDGTYYSDFSVRKLMPNSNLVWIDVTVITNKISETPSTRIYIGAMGGQLPLYEKESYVILEYTKDND